MNKSSYNLQGSHLKFSPTVSIKKYILYIREIFSVSAVACNII